MKIDPIEAMVLTAANEGLGNGVRQIIANLIKRSKAPATTEQPRTRDDYWEKKRAKEEAQFADLVRRWPKEKRIEVAKAAMAETKRVINSFPKNVKGFSVAWVPPSQFFTDAYKDFTDEEIAYTFWLNAVQDNVMAFELPLCDVEHKTLCESFNVPFQKAPSIYEFPESAPIVNKCCADIENIAKTLSSKFHENLSIDGDGDWEGAMFSLFLY